MASKSRSDPARQRWWQKQQSRMEADYPKEAPGGMSKNKRQKAPVCWLEFSKVGVKFIE